jgi:hypothetical protein
LKVKEAIRELDSAGANMRCKRLVDILESLKFVVKSGSKGNHKSFMHPDIPHFHGSSFDCGHKSNSEVKKFYVSSVRKTLNLYKDELEQIK